MDEHNIAYTVHYVDEDAQKAREMISKSQSRGVPFTVITQDNGEEQTILGFDEGALRLTLELPEKKEL